MKLRVTAVAIAAAVALVAIGTGCGGGDSATTTITKAEFIKRGDAICRKTDKEQQKLLGEYTAQYQSWPAAKQENAKSAEGQKRLVREWVLPSLTAEVKQLAALPSPDRQTAEAEAVVVAFEEAIAKVESTPSVVIRNPLPVFSPANRLARLYGFEDCEDLM